jgi:cysteinyl-tRNA synthetase
MNIRFFILQAHYRSTLDFSNRALQSSDKALKRLMNVFNQLEKIKPGSEPGEFSTAKYITRFHEAMNDDLNTAVAIAVLFEISDQVTAILDGKYTITKKELTVLKEFLRTAIDNILGLRVEKEDNTNSSRENELIEFIIDLRLEARNRKDFLASDAIRNKLAALGIILKDTKDGTAWEIN